MPSGSVGPGEVETDATSNDQPREEPPAIGAVEMGVGREFYDFIILQQTQASLSLIHI